MIGQKKPKDLLYLLFCSSYLDFMLSDCGICLSRSVVLSKWSTGIFYFIYLFLQNFLVMGFKHYWNQTTSKILHILGNFETKTFQMGVCGLICVTLGLLDIKFGNKNINHEVLSLLLFQSCLWSLVLCVLWLSQTVFTDVSFVSLMTSSGRKCVKSCLYEGHLTFTQLLVCVCFRWYLTYFECL